MEGLSGVYGPAAGMRQCWLSSARRPGEHHGPGVEGGTRHRTRLGCVKRGNPVTVRRERPPAGRQQRGTPWQEQDGSRSERRQPKGSRKARGGYRPLQAVAARITGRIAGLCACARKGADVSQVAL
jgi:hypothetical protein